MINKFSLNFETILGVLILIISLFIFTNMLSKLETKSNFSSFNLYANYNNIGNLEIGSSVKINGVLVGNIKNLRLDPDNYFAIAELNFDKEYSLPVDSIFSISSEGLVGGSYLNITPGSNSILFNNNDTVLETLDAVSLENIISDIIFSN
ncbi:MlaD family protein [Alphaproteobacteria bacterium]|nr:MlaD family protein [Alphaproteobacteria bacterium]